MINQPMPDAIVSIIIVNWNSGDLLAHVFSSILQYHQGMVAAVIIVDNASSDNSLEQLLGLQNLPFKLQIVQNANNRGFGVACNQGASLTTSEYLLFLNPDTQLFEDSLSNSLSFMQRTSSVDIGICGIRLVDEDGHASISVARFPTLRVIAGKILCLSKLFPNVFPTHLMSSAELNKSGFVDQVIGAFFLIRKNVFDHCGGFDERFFVYFEEVDLSLRAKQLGYSSYFLSEVSAFHKGGGCSERVKSTRLFYLLRSRIQYAHKHYSRNEFISLILLTGIELPLRLIQGILRASWSDINNTFAAYWRLVAYYVGRVDGVD